MYNQVLPSFLLGTLDSGRMYFRDIWRNTTTWIKNFSIKKKNRIFRDRYKGGPNVTIIRSQAGR